MEKNKLISSQDTPSAWIIDLTIIVSILKHNPFFFKVKVYFNVLELRFWIDLLLKEKKLGD